MIKASRKDGCYLNPYLQLMAVVDGEEYVYNGATDAFEPRKDDELEPDTVRLTAEQIERFRQQDRNAYLQSQEMKEQDQAE